MELEHLHVLERDPTSPDHGRAVARQRVGVRGNAEHATESARGEHDRFRAEDMELPGCQFVGDDARGPAVIGSKQVEAVELVEEADVALHALLVEGLQDHVAGPVGRVAGALHRTVTVLGGVSTEPPLVDLAVGCPVEGQTPPLELVDRLDRLFAHHHRFGLVDEVVATLHGVEGVPLGVVLLHVSERGADATLRRAGVGTGRVELRDDRGADLVGEFDRGAHARAAAADHDRVVGVGRRHLTSPLASSQD
jgi:hypothetical protein